MKKFDGAEYIRTNYRTFAVRVDRRRDPEVIKALEESANVSGYVRDLVKKDIKDGKEKECV